MVKGDFVVVERGVLRESALVGFEAVDIDVDDFFVFGLVGSVVFGPVVVRSVVVGPVVAEPVVVGTVVVCGTFVVVGTVVVVGTIVVVEAVVGTNVEVVGVGADVVLDEVNAVVVAICVVVLIVVVVVAVVGVVVVMVVVYGEHDVLRATDPHVYFNGYLASSPIGKTSFPCTWNV